MARISRFADAAGQVDAERAERAAARPPACRLCRLLGSLPGEDVDFIRGMLVDADRSGSYIADVLTTGGVPVSSSAVKRHRTEHASR